MIDINEFMIKYKNKEIIRENFIICFFGIIEPIPYDMSKNDFIFKDFGVIFWSTDLKTRETIKEDFELTLSQLTTSTFPILIESNKILKQLHKYSNTRFDGHDNQTRLSLFFEGYNLILKLLLINIAISEKRGYHLTIFETPFIDKIKRFWIYVGTKKLELQQITSFTNDLLDSCGRKEGKKNAFGPIILEKKKNSFGNLLNF